MIKALATLCSRVNKGSDVTFYFNYGDGSTETVIGENRNDMVIAKTSHIYHKGKLRPAY